MDDMTLPSHSKLVTIAQMQQLEAKTDAGGHFSYAEMMEAAGQAVADAIVASTPSSHDLTTSPYSALNESHSAVILILVGPGNNGGDALVCARHLAQAGFSVRTYLWQRNTEVEQDYEQHYAKALALHVETMHVDQDDGLSILAAWLAEADVVVDGLLGTGNSRPIAEGLADILVLVKSTQKERVIRLVAVDCPSGLYCDSGQVDPHTVPADLTVTFGYAKWGHLRFPGLSYCGELAVVDIGIPPTLADSVNTFLLQPDWLAKIAPHRDINSHKGTFGKVLAAVGCRNYPGAAFLACAAAGRVGAGLITGAVASSIWPIVAGRLAEPTWLPLPESQSGRLTREGAAQVSEPLKGYTAFLLGCGLGQGPDTLAFVQSTLQSGPLPPTLIDADGLNLLAQVEDWPSLLPAETLLTPHPAEMSRLCGMEVEEVRENRWALAQEKATEWNAVVLLKGPYTVIASPNGRLAVLPIATPALATAGTGDVLAGTITGLMAQGLAPFEAACVGAWIHGKAGERCGEEIGLAGVIASDLLPRLPQELQKLNDKVRSYALA